MLFHRAGMWAVLVCAGVLLSSQSGRADTCTNTVDTSSKCFGRQASDYELAVTSSSDDCKWYMDVKAAWIRMNGIPNKGELGYGYGYDVSYGYWYKGGGTINFSIFENDTRQTRSGSLVFRDSTFNVIGTKTMTQRGNSPMIPYTVILNDQSN